jgi:quinol monooxygenase YgiN
MYKLNHKILFLILISLAFSASTQAQDKSPVYYLVYLDVDPSSIDMALELLSEYDKNSAGVSGNLQIEILQRDYRPNQFVMLDAWRDQSSRQAHVNSSITHEFRESLKSILTAGYDEHEQTGIDVVESSDTGALHVVTHVDFKPPEKDKGIAELHAVAPKVRNADGNISFNIIAQPSRGNHLTVVEIWESRRAYAVHNETSIFKDYRHSIQPLMGSLYDERLYTPIQDSK